jgi:hypothetical protein
MINFEFLTYVQRKKWNKTTVSSEELMAANRKQNLKTLHEENSKTLYE